MSGISTYSLPATAAPKLEAMVDQIIARPGKLIDLKAMEQTPERLDVRAIIDALPEGITEEDFVKMLRLAMLTECGTDSYAAVFQEGADKYNANWLNRFNQKVWVPDEYTHTLPYYMMLRSIGFTEEELDRQIRALLRHLPYRTHDLRHRPGIPYRQLAWPACQSHETRGAPSRSFRQLGQTTRDTTHRLVPRYDRHPGRREP